MRECIGRFSQRAFAIRGESGRPAVTPPERRSLFLRRQRKQSWNCENESDRFAPPARAQGRVEQLDAAAGEIVADPVGARPVVIAAIEQTEIVCAILRCLGLASRGPPTASARSTQLLCAPDFELAGPADEGIDG